METRPIPETEDKELLDNKEYKLEVNKDKYNLYIEIFSDETILIKLKQSNVLTNIQYREEFCYESIIKELYSLNKIYPNIKEVFALIDYSINKNRFNLIKNEQNKTMILSIKININSKEMESNLSLKQELTSNNEIIYILINEMNQLKSKLEEHSDNYDDKNIINRLNEIQNKLIQQNEENNNKINELNKIINEKDIQLKELENKIKKDKEDIDSKIKELENRILKNNKDNNNKIQLLQGKFIELINENKKQEGDLEENEVNNNEELINDFEDRENEILIDKNDNLEDRENEKHINKNDNLEDKENELFINKNDNLEDRENKLLINKNDNLEIQNEIKINNDEKDIQKNEINKELENDENLNFKENPEKLEYIGKITDQQSDGGLLFNFEVFKGLKDKIEYIVFCSKINFNLNIMNIISKEIITSLEGHSKETSIIKYYKKDKKEDYLLSADYNKKIIIWDIQNNFNKKYCFNESYKGNIYDGLILFYISQKNYIILSSGSKDEYLKLYELEGENNKLIFIKNIFEKTVTGTEYLIYWKNNNKHYVIELGANKIIINNIFDKEEYAVFPFKGKSRCGYIYNEIYLCSSAMNKNSISIWDLKNKILYKEILFSEKSGYELIPWNNEYAILGCDKGIIVFNMKEFKKNKKINISNNTIKGIKKIKLNDINESIIYSDGKGSINILGFKK